MASVGYVFAIVIGAIGSFLIYLSTEGDSPFFSLLMFFGMGMIMVAIVAIALIYVYTRQQKYCVIPHSTL